MKYNFPKTSFFLSLAFFFVSIFSFYLLNSKIKSDGIEADKMFSEWQNGYKQKEETKLLNDFLKKTVEARSVLNSHFAQSSDVVPFLDMLESLATSVGAKAEVLVINVPDDNTGLYVEAKASGPFGSIYKFIKLLENSPYETEIISMNMSNAYFSADSKVATGWSINLKIKLLSFIK